MSRSRTLSPTPEARGVRSKMPAQKQREQYNCLDTGFQRLRNSGDTRKRKRSELQPKSIEARKRCNMLSTLAAAKQLGNQHRYASALFASQCLSIQCASEPVERDVGMSHQTC